MYCQSRIKRPPHNKRTLRSSFWNHAVVAHDIVPESSARAGSLCAPTPRANRSGTMTWKEPIVLEPWTGQTLQSPGLARPGLARKLLVNVQVHCQCTADARARARAKARAWTHCSHTAAILQMYCRCPGQGPAKDPQLTCNRPVADLRSTSYRLVIRL